MDKMYDMSNIQKKLKQIIENIYKNKTLNKNKPWGTLLQENR